MDKRKVVEAYRRGLITLQECSQILGADKNQLMDLVIREKPRRPLKSDAALSADPGAR